MNTTLPPFKTETPQITFYVIGNLPLASWHPKLIALDINSLNTYLPNDEDVLIISLPSDQQDNLLLQLRSQSQTALLPVWVEHASSLSPYLANNSFHQDNLHLATEYFTRKKQVKLKFDEDTAFRLLTWLWVYQTDLTPINKPSDPSLYEHPLLTAWNIPVQDSFPWLSRLRKKGWLSSNGLHNRIRLCSHCYSGHLNYVDVCPQCQHLDIELRASLHCFNCGHVGNQDSFRKAPGLCCPNCLQALRHIGVDYDRPIENQYCNSCHALFTEALVEAQCLDCNTHASVDSLKVRNIHHYGISSTGKRLVRQGITAEHLELQVGETLTNQQFNWLIDWQNQLAKRHQHVHSIAYIEILNLNDFIQSEGETTGLALLDALQERLSGLVRVTDPCSNTLSDGLLIFLPFTSEAQVNVIYEKLKLLTTEQTRTPLHLRFRTVSLPDDIGVNVKDWISGKLDQAKPYTI